MHANMTLAEIVTRDPGTAPLLEAHHLDYCCGGNQTLADACTSAGLDTGLVVAELTAAPAAPAAQWSQMAPGALVDHLEVTHHAYLHRELPRLTALADKVARVHGSRHPELAEVSALVHGSRHPELAEVSARVHGSRHPELAEVSALVTALRADLEPHLTKEERVLFPMIRELDSSPDVPAFPCGSLTNPIRAMLAEHDHTGELLEQLRHVTNDYAVPTDGCASYQALYRGLAALEADTHLHVHKENNVLFPAVLAIEQRRTA